MYTIDDEEEFDNLMQLVEHHQKDADGLVTRLCVPVAKEGKQCDYTVDMDDFKKCECMIAIHASFHLFYKNTVGRLQTDGILLVLTYVTMDIPICKTSIIPYLFQLQRLQNIKYWGKGCFFSN